MENAVGWSQEAEVASSKQGLGRYSVARHGIVSEERFASFYEGYMYALNLFCSEYFVVLIDGE
ncbi:hypothetical protein ACFSC6_10340 [Rufibacter sediminis]|uniref:Uncharacterized protein n=1 Tax=Rufibacter sediminis TaxID=2762756 RepID=A0ABR6VPT3_9BACT|nr:hypothetical protein [Rufibacter sediminis]MBC3538935.1 hypothetical protein [Rufibacter sediminis]